MNDELVKMLDQLCRVLKLATLDEMGGTPDLFGPEGGWESWDEKANEVLARAERMRLPNM